MPVNRTVLIGVDPRGGGDARQTLREIFREGHCTVVGASGDTDELLRSFERHTPDVVVIDVMLTGTLDALLAIDRMRRSRASVTIFATGSTSQNGVLMEALSMGAVDFFLKPFRPQAVRNCLERNLG